MKPWTLVITAAVVSNTVVNGVLAGLGGGHRFGKDIAVVFALTTLLVWGQLSCRCRRSRDAKPAQVGAHRAVLASFRRSTARVPRAFGWHVRCSHFDRMLRVRDIMRREVVSLAADATLDSAQWTLADLGVTGAPVRDDSGRVVGMLSQRDLVSIMRAHDPRATVRKVMNPAVWSVEPDAPALDAVALMVEKGIHRVLVLRGDKLEGIVTATDIMRSVLEGHSFSTAPSTEPERKY